MTTFGRTFGPAFGRTLGSIFDDIQSGQGGGVSLIFLASYYDGDDYAQLLVKGKGTSTVVHTASVYQPDYLGFQREFKDGETVWRGGRVIFDPDQLVISLTASATTPQPLANLRCDFNDGSTASYHWGDQMLRDVASAVNVGRDVAVSDGDSVNVYAGNLTSMTRLYLNLNQLTGSIPTEIGNLTSLAYLYLNNNQLTGSIPTEISDLTSLIILYLHTNQLTGSIPTEIGNLTSLAYLYLNNNQLTGSIPTEISDLTSLIILDLRTNQLTDYAGGATFTFTTAINFRADSNLLTESAVNNLFIDFDNGTLVAASTINIGGTGNAPPTGAGLDAANSLIAKGHIVTHN